MSVNIKTSNGLLEIGGSVTKSKVISALGYSPANESVVNNHTNNDDIHITESEREKLSAIDSHIGNGNIHITAAERERWNNNSGSQSDFSGNYNDLTNKPNINDDGSGELSVQDESGNSVFKVNSNGVRTINVNTNALVLNNKNIKAETWTFTLEDGSTVTKAVLVG